MPTTLAAGVPAMTALLPMPGSNGSKLPGQNLRLIPLISVVAMGETAVYLP